MILLLMVVIILKQDTWLQTNHLYLKKHLVAAAITKYEGQISTWKRNNKK